MRGQLDMFEYNPNQSYATTALTVSHTVLPAVFTEVTFWLFFIVHFTLWFFKDPMPMVSNDPHCEVNWSHLEVLVAVSNFFLVTYVGDVFHRYCDVYYAVKTLFSGVTDFVLEMKFYTKAKHVLWLRLSARYLLAALCIFLNRPLENREKVPAEEYEQLIQRRLLRPEEVAALSDLLRQHAGTVVCHWAARVVHQSFTEMGMTSNQMRSLLDRILFIRQVQQSVLDTVKKPLPYPYFHLLNLVLLVKLSILAYGYARMNSIFAPIGWMCSSLALVISWNISTHLMRTRIVLGGRSLTTDMASHPSCKRATATASRRQRISSRHSSAPRNCQLMNAVAVLLVKKRRVTTTTIECS